MPETKLVLSDNIVISLDTEFIENENVSKNDCEINAAKRLNSNAMRNHDLLTQISDIVMQ